MESYQIKILDAQGQTLMDVQDRFMDDFAAVRQARVLSEGRAVEVWLGDSRIFWTELPR